MFLKRLVVILLIFSLLLSQDEYCFDAGEIKELYSVVNELEQSDSLNTIIIDNLKEQLDLYSQKSVKDSIIFVEQDKQIELLKELVKQTEPKWYEHKYLWFGYGILSILIPSWVVSNIK